MDGTGRLLAAALLACSVLASGCGTIYLDVPNGSNVKLLAKDDPVEVKAQRRVWYYLWGGRYFDGQDPHAWTLVEENGLTEARLEMTNTFVDAVLSVPLSLVSISSRTIKVEGNR